ncbi:TenA family protein [Pseudonocardia sp. H11422]|uniref:TenA family protein n=1 Tax=Pseudonocardia sp. H11422 TaxID=2835866 RepID=UPI001BDDA38B|nr:TenA family protein [Pseudonocardia sp. H11422]
MTFSEELRASTATVWDAAVGHRFVDELWQGTLPRDVLTRYLVQDNQFLDSFVALLGAAIAGSGRGEPRLRLARQLGLVAGPENDFFARAFDALDVPAADRTRPELLPPTAGFIAHMDDVRENGRYPDQLAVLLVAEWLYLDWATRPGADLPVDPIAREWIELHRGPAFEEWVGFLRTEFDKATADLGTPHRQAVTAHFTHTVDLERKFFEATCAA